MTQGTLSTKEAADQLHVSDQTIVNWWHDGTLTGYKTNPKAANNSPLRIYQTSVEKLRKERAKAKASGHRIR